MLAQDGVDLLVQALKRDFEFDPLADAEAFELDPVARITQEEEATPQLPTALAPSPTRPMDTLDDIDVMTTSPRERRQAEETFAQQTPGSPAAFQAAEAATGLEKLTTDSFVKKMLAREGLEYEWGGTSAKTGFDCSGIIWRIMHNQGFNNFPRTSGEIYAHSKHISKAQAIKTRGAILWREGHIEISLGNGRTIGAGSEGTGVRIGTPDQFTHGGILPELAVAKAIKKAKAKPQGQGRVLAQRAPTDLPQASITSPVSVFGSLLDELDAPLKRGKWKPDPTVPTQRRGIKGQLYDGFMAAGRPDLAKMVFTQAFDTWIGAESGWIPGRVSDPYEGIRNYGLFQFRNLEGRDWLTKYIKKKGFTASPYEQALLVAKNFDLTSDDIKRYAVQVRDGYYEGWS